MVASWPEVSASSLFVSFGSAALVAISVTYLIAGSTLGLTAKMASFIVLIAVFLSSSALLHIWRSARSGLNVTTEPNIDRQLAALDDANEFFAGSINTADAFRLVASRVRQLLPGGSISLHLFDTDRTALSVVAVDAVDVRLQKGDHALLTAAAVKRSVLSGGVQIDDGASAAGAVIAIPLRNGNEVFGVLGISFEKGSNIGVTGTMLPEAIGSRVSPFILASLVYEKSRSNALTDWTTDLPNELAFHIVLENRVAESSRPGPVRPLTILAVDVSKFDSINSRFGHAAGDRLLAFTAQAVKQNLREMDFFARTTGDEFLILLPTASAAMAHDVIARLHAGLQNRKFNITTTESVEVALNIGWAAFGPDGDTPGTLLANARTRKDQSKSIAPTKVLWFPSEYASRSE